MDRLPKQGDLVVLAEALGVWLVLYDARHTGSSLTFIYFDLKKGRNFTWYSPGTVDQFDLISEFSA